MRKQKKSNNKGFSLVELIVVIAIMAVLIGVLAPTVISNIEKSKEAKDKNRLDNFYSAIQVAYGDEKGNEDFVKNYPADSSPFDVTALSGTGRFKALVEEYLGGTASFVAKSKAATDANVYFSISDKGVIRVWLAKTAVTTAISCDKSGGTFEVE